MKRISWANFMYYAALGYLAAMVLFLMFAGGTILYYGLLR